MLVAHQLQRVTGTKKKHVQIDTYSLWHQTWAPPAVALTNKKLHNVSLSGSSTGPNRVQHWALRWRVDCGVTAQLARVAVMTLSGFRSRAGEVTRCDGASTNSTVSHDIDPDTRPRSSGAEAAAKAFETLPGLAARAVCQRIGDVDSTYTASMHLRRRIRAPALKRVQTALKRVQTYTST